MKKEQPFCQTCEKKTKDCYCLLMYYLSLSEENEAKEELKEKMEQ